MTLPTMRTVFFVDYQPMGSNMVPDVTIIVRDRDS